MQRLEHEMLLEQQEVDELRETELKKFVARSAALMQEKARLMLSVPPPLRKLLEDVNLPLIQALLREVVVHDHIVFENLVEGFPVLGSLPDVNYGSKPMPEAKQHMLSQEWLRQIREANNRKVLSKIKESEHSEDVWQQTIQDAMLDRMTWPIEVQDYHILHTTLCRRIGVREYREYKKYVKRVYIHALGIITEERPSLEAQKWSECREAVHIRYSHYQSFFV